MVQSVGWFGKQQDRILTIKDVIVTGFHPLTLHCTEEYAELPMPSFAMDNMVGEVEDLNGHRVTVRTGRLMLNAGIVNVEKVYNA